MPATPKIEPSAWDLLAAPFPQDEVERLPKALAKDGQKGNCTTARQGVCADEHPCGGYHARAIHLSYVGHAGVTMRLNSVDPTWFWEPMALTPGGTPLFTDGGLWIRLTVNGATRIGFGDAGGKSGTNAVKEIIGDAIRNAAMRFGVGTYLWSKSEAAQVIAAGGDPDADAGGTQQAPQAPDQGERRAERPVHNVQKLHTAFQPLSDEQKAWLRQYAVQVFKREDVAPANLSDLETTMVVGWAGMLARGEDPSASTTEPQAPDEGQSPT